MCTRQAPRHSKCGHAVSIAYCPTQHVSRTDHMQAHGTVCEGAKLVRCELAKHRRPCGPVRWESFEVARAYCDSCIINGEFLAQRTGLDPGVYSRRLGARYLDLKEANPQTWTQASAQATRSRGQTSSRTTQKY
jgi:hypothetical protein